MKNLLGTAVSQPGGAPYNNVNRASAIAACEASTGYTLINNRQWQTIARDIESVASNWENGTPGGVNRLSRGVSSGSGPFPADVSNPCFNTGDTCNATTWKPQRRTNVLSNGSVIWDFAGNVQEWVQGTTDELRVYPDIASGQKEFSTLSTRNQNIFGPALAISSTNGAGMIAGSGNATIVRGGAYDSGAAMIGVFATRVTMSGGSIATNLGFRCVYTP